MNVVGMSGARRRWPGAGRVDHVARGVAPPHILREKAMKRAGMVAGALAAVALAGTVESHQLGGRDLLAVIIHTVQVDWDLADHERFVLDPGKYHLGHHAP